jgi:hypothetical protein
MNPATLPPVSTLIEKFQIKGVTVHTPQPDEVQPLCAEDSPRSPKSEVTAIRLLQLRPHSITPVHSHPKGSREKIYVHISDEAIVYQLRNGEWKAFILNAANRVVVVPPKTPHSMVCTNDQGCSTFVVQSTQDGSDILWE